MVKERGSDAEREIDLLATVPMLNSNFRLAIECRDHGRMQTLDWIDSLIGKFKDLDIDKVIAVSPTGFSPAAVEKAAANRIELVTAKQASKVDWAAVLHRPWKALTHSFTLMRIITEQGEKVVTRTDVDAKGVKATHADRLSEAVYVSLRQHFFDNMSADVVRAIDAQIGKCWQKYIADPTPTWTEVYVDVEGEVLMNETERHHIDRICFGIGTFFKVTEQTPKSYVVNDLLVEQFSQMFPEGPIKVRWARDRAGNLRHIEIRAAPEKRKLRRAP